eukprot:15237218-Alexandrium_andersonii.AAC.1
MCIRDRFPRAPLLQSVGPKVAPCSAVTGPTQGPRRGRAQGVPPDGFSHSGTNSGPAAQVGRGREDL